MKQRIKNIAASPKRLIILSLLVVVMVASLIACTGLKKEQEAELISSIEEIHNLDDNPEFKEYEAYFNDHRDIENAFVLMFFKTDADNSGSDELYTKSVLNSDDSFTVIIECYDLETNTYSNLLATDEWDYNLVQYKGRLYIFAINQYQRIDGENFRVYQSQIVNGKLSTANIDAELEQEVLDYISSQVVVGAHGNMDSQTLPFTGEDVASITMYDISTEEVILGQYTEDDVIKKFMLLYDNMDALYEEDLNRELNHTLKAEINLGNELDGESLIVLFGDEEYITAIEHDGGTGNWKNNGLKNYLLGLAGVAPQSDSQHETINGLQVIDHNNWYPEYAQYFDDARGTEDIYMLRLYKADINYDGTPEIYAVSRETTNRYTAYVLECYDLKTNTYSKITAPEGLEYFPNQFEGKVYLLAIYDKDINVEQRFNAYEPYLEDGKLNYTEIDADLETKITNYWIFGTGQNNVYKLDISIYDLSEEAVLIRSFSQESDEITQEMAYIFGFIENADGEESDYNYRADIRFNNGNTEESFAIFYGPSEYFAISDNGTTYYFVNDELLEFLISLSDDTN